MTTTLMSPRRIRVPIVSRMVRDTTSMSQIQASSRAAPMMMMLRTPRSNKTAKNECVSSSPVGRRIWTTDARATAITIGSAAMKARTAAA